MLVNTTQFDTRMIFLVTRDFFIGAMENFTNARDGFLGAEIDKLLESSKSLSLNLQALSSKLGLVQNEIQA